MPSQMSATSSTSDAGMRDSVPVVPAEQSPPRSAAAFRVVTAAIALALAASGTPSPLYVDYQAQWHFSAATLTIIYAMYAGGVVVTLLLAGGLSDRVGRRPVLLGSVVALMASLVVFLLADSTVWLGVARLLQGLATGVFTGAAAAALTELHPRRDSRIAALVNSMSTSMGIAVGAVLAGALAQWAPFPLRTPYVVLMVASAVVLVVIALRVPETVTRQDKLRLGALLRPQRISIPPETRKQFVIGCLGVLAAWSVGGLYLGLGGSLAKELLHVNNHLVAGLVILTVQGVGGLSQLGFTRVSGKTASVLGCVALIVGMAVVSTSVFVSSAVLFLLGDAVTGVGFGLAFMGGTRLVTQAAPAAKRGQVLATFFVVAYLAISVPVIAAGVVSVHIGLSSTFYLFAAIMAVIALVTLVCTLLSRDADPTT
ncbi:MFS transporter [Amycolatopsis sp. H20-H5]|uniref:MFS transporter n=1 Tax=Amycolatopsis sp. H20-H5 TaxID=3046309 RepID=UPI002DBBFFD9|nr:MFS transporter [Amycolatopsis sp. H20-H5]MEC3980944.1 MFS transporter [Amycolatopsis sp. H20-H5]